MKNPTLTLGIAQYGRGAKIYPDGTNDAPALTPEIKQKILARDENTCQFCGFKSGKWSVQGTQGTILQ